MKTEDFFKLTMEQVFGFNKSKIEKHFKKFRQEFKNIPSVLESLNEKVTDSKGIPLNSKDIHEDVKTLKNHLEKISPDLLSLFHWFIFNRIGLFSEEIKLQIEFLKFSFSEYEKEKQQEPINIKKIFLHIHHFSVHVANVCKLYDKLVNLIDLPFSDNLDINTTSTKELRNHLEHFEERLEAWNYLHIGKPVFDMNIINSSTKGIKLENCIRILEVDKDIFYILGERYSIKELHETINMIERKIFELEEWANNANSADAKKRAAD